MTPMMMEQPDLMDYIRRIPRAADFQPTGLTRSVYLDLMEAAIASYPLQELAELWGREEEGAAALPDIQTASRVACVLGGLLASGRQQQHLPVWLMLMEACCRKVSGMSGDIMADFAVKELLLAYRAMKPLLADSQLQHYRSLLATIDPYANYACTLAAHKDKAHLHNINVYNMVGEYLREAEGLTDSSAYFAAHWPLQLERFDHNGMYRDPGCPLLYDLTTRCQIQTLLAAGYRGSFYHELDENLQRGGLFTLFLQSAADQFPFGGRSNQFTFNEVLVAANGEYEAARYHRLGEEQVAAACKRNAHLAVRAIQRWVMEAKPPRHIKNGYPTSSGYGAEPYGYYDKYMITLGSFAYLAYLVADDAIAEGPCPAETGGYVIATSPDFHMIVAHAAGQSLQIDTSANPQDDATGLGRYHRRGTPAELALSIPFTATPGYLLALGLLAQNLSLCAGWDRGDGSLLYLADIHESLSHQIELREVRIERIAFQLIYSGPGLTGLHELRETYVLDETGLTLTAQIVSSLGGNVHYQIPLFAYDGEVASELVVHGNTIKVAYREQEYTITTSASFTVSDLLYGNRNGAYRLAHIQSATDTVTVHLRLAESIVV